MNNLCTKGAVELAKMIAADPTLPWPFLRERELAQQRRGLPLDDNDLWIAVRVSRAGGSAWFHGDPG